jgi:DNA-binding SARP family transcriptional activator
MIKKASIERKTDKISPEITLTLLGSPQIKVDQQPVRLPYLKAEVLFYYLAVTGRPHSRAALAALLWSRSSEKQARSSLRNALYTIRKGLKPADPLVIERETICLDLVSIRLDTSHFRATIEQTVADTSTLSEALALWQGAFLDDLHLSDAPAFEEWLTDQRAHFEALYRQGLFHLGHLCLSQKRFLDAQQAIDKLLTLDPLYEAGHQQLMRLYLQTGNRAAALRQYETLRQLLIEELGVDPDPSTQALHLELLHADEPHVQTSSPVNAPAKPLGRYQFVGREREMAMLFRFYQGILPGGPACLVMLEGEPGIGKTRLAREWLTTLDQARTLTTRCFEAEQAIPFQPWIDLIRTTLRQTPLPQLGLADVWLTELANLVPEIRLQRPDLALSPTTDPELARGRIIQAIFHWLETLCRQKPISIFIDDWQWLDQASLTLLRYILRSQQSNRLPLMILGAQRETQTMPGWSQFRTSLERDDMLQLIKLYRLSLADVAVLARSIALPKTIQTDSFLEQLLAETEGNPLFITEFLQSLTLDELRTNDWPIPQTIQSVIQSRLSRLGEATYQLLSAAAVIGRGFADTLLHQISDFSQETILKALDEAIGANLITEQANTYDFTHDKIRAVLLDNLTLSRRRHLHLQIAAALEATLSNDFGLLSYHFEVGGDYLRARTYGLQAARQTVELYADEDALHWYVKVEALTDRIESELSPAAIPKVTPFQQTHVSRTLPLDVPGLIYRQRGLIMQRIGQYDQAESEFQAALTRAQARNRLDEQAAAHNLLSFLAYLRSDYDGVGDHAQRALELATQADELSLRGPGLRHLGIAVYRTGDYARARQLYDEALVAYRQAGDRLGMAGVYNNIGFVLRTQANYAEAIEAFQEALTIYEATGQVEGVALICSNIGRTYAFSGDLEQAQRYLERGLALSVESHTDWIAVKIHRTMGNIFAQNGQWSRALAHAQQAQTLASTLGSDEDLGAALRLLAEIASAWPERNLGNPATYFEQSIALLQRVGAQDELERAESAYANYIRDVVSPTGPLGS